MLIAAYPPVTTFCPKAGHIHAISPDSYITSHSHYTRFSWILPVTIMKFRYEQAGYFHRWYAILPATSVKYRGWANTHFKIFEMFWQDALTGDERPSADFYYLLYFAKDDCQYEHMLCLLVEAWGPAYSATRHGDWLSPPMVLLFYQPAYFYRKFHGSRGLTRYAR